MVIPTDEMETFTSDFVTDKMRKLLTFVGHGDG